MKVGESALFACLAALVSGLIAFLDQPDASVRTLVKVALTAGLVPVLAYLRNPYRDPEAHNDRVSDPPPPTVTTVTLETKEIKP